ncbi:hypothetical protein ACFXPJ_31065, partial [Streptomyces goshikiensis]
SLSPAPSGPPPRRPPPGPGCARPPPRARPGSPVDTLSHALAHQHELILKPTLLHGGKGIVAGWTADAAQWEREVASAMDGPFVLQRRVRPASEPFPDSAGGSQELFLNWGVYLGARGADDDGYAGGFVRGSTDPAVGVVSMAGGATVGCVFHGGDH